MSLQFDCNLMEGKSFVGRRTFAKDKAILMSTLVRLIGSLRANLDKKMITQAVSDYASLKEEFRNSLFGILESYQRGEITHEVMESMWRSEIREAWEKAYGLGIRSVGNPFGIWEEDRSWLKGAEAEEFGYLGKFVEDIKKNELVMDLEERLAMYAETLDGVFHHGKVDGSPEFVKIHWILKEAKHCDECIRYAAGSPYTKKTLPAVPRDGTSRCLSNCRCELRFEYAEEKPKPEIYVIKGPKPMIAPEGYRLPSDKERDELAQMSTEIDRLRELIRITSGPQKKEYIQMRRDLNATMIDFMEKHKIYYVPMGQVQKTKFVESIADEVKKELLLEGGPGSGHWGHRGRPGMRGGSLPGAGTAGHGVARSSQMAAWLKAEMVAEGRRISPDEATVLLKRMFPGQPEERYGRALVKAGLGVLTKVEAPPDRPVLPIENVRQILNSKKVPVSGSDADKEFAYKTLALVPESHLRASGIRAITFMTRKEVNELWELRSGGKRAKGFDIDGFYDFDFGDLVLASKHGRSGEIVLLHEFGHSVGGKLKGKYQGEVWRKNGSTGKITSYGKENPKEAWAEGYWMFVLDRGRLKRKAPSIAEVYEGAFAE